MVSMNGGGEDEEDDWTMTWIVVSIAKPDYNPTWMAS